MASGGLTENTAVILDLIGGCSQLSICPDVLVVDFAHWSQFPQNLSPDRVAMVVTGASMWNVFLHFFNHPEFCGFVLYQKEVESPSPDELQHLNLIPQHRCLSTTKSCMAATLESAVPLMCHHWQRESDHRKLEIELDKARQMALTAESAKSDFLAIMNHEFRTPINAILGVFQLMEEGHRFDSEENLILVSKAKQATFGLMRTLSDIVDYIAFGQGEAMVAHTPYNLEQLMSEISQYFSSIASNQRLDFMLETSTLSTQGLLLGDPKRLRIVLSHLLSNSIKATERGFIKVTADSEYLGRGRHRIEICVSDSGSGIPQEKLNELFDLFSQTEQPEIRKNRGIGMGLALCKLIMDTLDGTIMIDSRLNQGTTFKPTLFMTA